jgi:O-antigen/teichoic acid export membrane protein
VLVTNYFSKPVAGAFFTAMSLFLIMEAIANLGAFNGAIYFIARLRALHAERRIPAVLRATMIPVVVSSLAAAAILIVFAGPAARVLLGGRTQGVSLASVAAAVRAMAAALPFAALADLLRPLAGLVPALPAPQRAAAEAAAELTWIGAAAEGEGLVLLGREGPVEGLSGYEHG